MTVVGVTGEFCSGKSTVSALFKKLGAHVIDADAIVRRMYKNDVSVKKKIVKKIGKKVFKKNDIDKMSLASYAFSSRKNLKALCSIIHPKVLKIIKREVARVSKSFIVVDAPLLIETGLYRSVDYVIVVKASRRVAALRCKKRGFSQKELDERLLFQMPFSEKIKFSDFVIDNNRTKAHIKKGVIKIWKQLNRG